MIVQGKSSKSKDFQKHKNVKSGKSFKIGESRLPPCGSRFNILGKEDILEDLIEVWRERKEEDWNAGQER